jgi:hypothetical protein
LEPVLAAAFEDAGIRRRTPALPFNATYVIPAELLVEDPKPATESATMQAADKVIEHRAEQAAQHPQRVKKAKRRPRVSSAAEQVKPAADAEDRWTGIVCTGSLC